MPRPTLLAADEAVINQVAALAATGLNVNNIATQLNTSRYHVKKILDTPLCKDLLKEIGEDAVATAKNIVKNQAVDLTTEAIRVLKAKMAKDDLEAAKTVFKIVGVDQQMEAPKGDTNIQVILPGQEPNAIQVEHSTIETQNDYDDQG